MRHLFVLLPCALLLAACGGSSDGAGEGGGVVQTVRVSETEFSISPTSLHLPRAGTYAFSVTNDGQITHALNVEESGGGDEVESGDIGPGETKTVRFIFSGNGSFELYCPIGNHKDQGMEGTITVGGAAGGTGTTTGETETETEPETTTDEATTGTRPGY
jgi:plastocyanin